MSEPNKMARYKGIKGKVVNGIEYYSESEVRDIFQEKRWSFSYKRQKGLLPFTPVKILGKYNYYRKDEINGYLEGLK